MAHKHQIPNMAQACSDQFEKKFAEVLRVCSPCSEYTDMVTIEVTGVDEKDWEEGVSFVEDELYIANALENAQGARYDSNTKTIVFTFHFICSEY
jgi:hypothetical protein